MLHTDSISSIHKSSQVYSARDFVETPSSLVRSVSNSHPVKSSIPIYPIDRSRSPQHSVSRMDLSDLGPAQGLTPSPSFTLSSSPIASTSDNSSAILDTLSPEVDRKSCALLGSLAVGIQAFLGLAVLGSLLAKRAREHPRRPWNIWTMDISKQVVGQAFIHGSNLLISDVTSHRGANACGVYVSNILIDTTIGVFILYLFLQLAAWLLISQCGLFHLRSGWYGEPPQLSYWVKQLLIYVACLAGMKAIVVIMFSVWPDLYNIGDWLLEWVADDQDAQVIISILVVPVIMNVFQFLVIDQILKGYSSFSLLSDEEVPEPLLANQGALSDDEGDHHEDDKTLTPDPASARHSKISFDKYEIGSPSWEDRSSDASPPPTINIQLPNAKRDYGTSRPSSPTGNRTPEYSC